MGHPMGSGVDRGSPLRTGGTDRCRDPRLGRALGETMAVTMLIGNRHDIGLSVLQPAYTMAAAIANEFSEATTDLYLSALFEVD